MSGTLQLEIVTPERVLLSQKVDEVVAPGYFGEFGVLPEHTPFITIMEIGLVRFRMGDEEKEVVVSGGFVEVLDNKVVILARTAEYGHEIDLERAQNARERAEGKLQDLSLDDEEYATFDSKLRRAMMRIHIANL